MKTLLLLLLTITSSYAQEPKATIALSNGQFINNAPSGRDWKSYKVSSLTTYEAQSDTSYFDNDQLANMTYYGKWNHAASGCFCSYSNAANDSLVFMFTDATYFEWRGELMSHHGIADVYFDDKYIGEVDTYDTRNLAQTRNWRAENLDPGKVYKFKLVVTGRKNAASAGAYIVNHGFRIIKQKVDPPVPEPCDPKIVYVTDTVIVTNTITDTVWIKPEIFINYKPMP